MSYRNYLLCIIFFFFFKTRVIKYATVYKHSLDIYLGRVFIMHQFIILYFNYYLVL